MTARWFGVITVTFSLACCQVLAAPTPIVQEPPINLRDRLMLPGLPAVGNNYRVPLDIVRAVERQQRSRDAAIKRLMLPLREKFALASLPDIGWNYKVDPYIEAAIQLQRLGKDEAIKRLAAAADDYTDAVFVLCRMLFLKASPSGSSLFRRPSLGQAWFSSEEITCSDWPLEPIELVDGVPFLIVTGYFVEGQTESPLEYLNYCVRNCEWSTYRYRRMSQTEKQHAVERLLSLGKWKKGLAVDPREILMRQIQ